MADSQQSRLDRTKIYYTIKSGLEYTGTNKQGNWLDYGHMFSYYMCNYNNILCCAPKMSDMFKLNIQYMCIGDLWVWQHRSQNYLFISDHPLMIIALFNRFLIILVEQAIHSILNTYMLQ